LKIEVAMRKIEITLPDEIAQQLDDFATQAGVTVDALLAKGIQSRLHELADSTPRQWMPREQWDALVRGENCPLCEAVALTEPTNEFGITVADLSMSRLRLDANQGVMGYCVLMCKTHVREPYELSPADRARYFEDMMRAAQALEKVFNPVKMNFEILGNAAPHLHCHIKPRYYGDPAGGTPIWPSQYPHFPSPQTLAERAALIKAALSTYEGN
jgi:diadenosine tetraphosphate (Ap4A) HIT family hydrolase